MSPEEVLESSPEILDGEPVFRGTRVPVHALLEHVKRGQEIDGFIAAFPAVSRAQAEAVLSFVREAHDDPGPQVSTVAATVCSPADLEACRRGDWTVVAARLRRKATWILSISLLVLAVAVGCWLYVAAQTGRYSLLVFVVLPLTYGGWERFRSLRRAADSLDASARRAALR